MRLGHVSFEPKLVKQSFPPDSLFPHHQLHPSLNDQSENAAVHGLRVWQKAPPAARRRSLMRRQLIELPSRRAIVERIASL
jgi:hypothetical protein